MHQGQIPINPTAGNVGSNRYYRTGRTVHEECGHQSLRAAGASYDKVVKTTCFLADIADFAAFNESICKVFLHRIRRSCVMIKRPSLQGEFSAVEVTAYLK